MMTNKRGIVREGAGERKTTDKEAEEKEKLKSLSPLNESFEKLKLTVIQNLYIFMLQNEKY